MIPSAATFASTLVEAVSAPQTFTVRNDGNAASATRRAGGARGNQRGRLPDHLERLRHGAATGRELRDRGGLRAEDAERVEKREPRRRRVGRRGRNVSLSGTALPSPRPPGGWPGRARQRRRDGRGRPLQRARSASPATGRATSTSPTDNDHPEGRHRDRGRHHARGRAGPGRQRRRDGRGRPLQPASGIASDGAGNLYVADSGNQHDPEDRHRDRRRHHVRGRGGQSGERRRDGRGRPLPRPGRHRQRRGRQPLRRRHRNDHPEGRHRDRGRHHARGRGGPGRQRGRDGRGRPLRRTVGIASDGAGNLYVADGNDTIRKIVIATGAVTTLAGTAGQPAAPTGRARPPASTRQPASPATGRATSTSPTRQRRPIRKVVIATGAVTTLAGAPGQSGSADGTGAGRPLQQPGGIASDGAGNLYVADTGNNTIRKSSSRPGPSPRSRARRASPAAPTGPAPAARFNSPSGVASDGAGNLYVADTGNSTIRKIVIATGAVTTLAGAAGQAGGADGTGAAANFDRPGGSPATAPATSTSPTRQRHHPEDRHRDRGRHHARGRGRARPAAPTGRARPPASLRRRHRQRRGGQPLRRRHRQRHHPEGRHRDRRRHHASAGGRRR